MTISGELREMGRVMTEDKERKDSYFLSESEKRTVKKIETIMKERGKEIVGSGRSADVFLLNIWENAEKGVTPWVIKQESRRTREQEILETSLEKEMYLQDKAHQIIERAEKDNPDKKYARIPKPLSLLMQEKKKWLIMEYIPGETLFERAMRQVLITYNEDNVLLSKEDIEAMSKEEMLDLLSSDEYRSLLPPRVLEELNNGGELDEQSFIYIGLLANRSTKGPSKILTLEQYEALENTLNELHKNRLWHRDLHASNIKLGPTGDMTILDFGLSTTRTEEEIREGKGLYTLDVGHAFHERVLRLPSDEGMLEQYQKIARKIR